MAFFTPTAYHPDRSRTRTISQSVKWFSLQTRLPGSNEAVSLFAVPFRRCSSGQKKDESSGETKARADIQPSARFACRRCCPISSCLPGLDVSPLEKWTGRRGGMPFRATGARFGYADKCSVLEVHLLGLKQIARGAVIRMGFMTVLSNTCLPLLFKKFTFYTRKIYLKSKIYSA